MSQEKVARNKELKSKRKQINQQKKFRSRMISTVTAIICIAFVFWIGYSVVTGSSASEEGDNKTVVNFESINDYLTDISESLE